MWSSARRRAVGHGRAAGHHLVTRGALRRAGARSGARAGRRRRWLRRRRKPSAPACCAADLSFGWDQDDYGKERNSVYVYVSGLDGVEIEARVVRLHQDVVRPQVRLGGSTTGCSRTASKTRSTSKAVVKKNRVTVQLRKVKGEYGHKSWINLTAKRQKSEATKADPTAGIMDMMKELYEDGDDQMRKTLGEAMLKSREKNGPMGGMGDGLGDL